MAETLEVSAGKPNEAPSQGAPILTVRALEKSYGDRAILKGVDIDVAPGEKVALIGPSGSGKTTVLRMIMGLERPNGGTIRIDNQYLWHREVDGRLVDAGEPHARKVRRRVGMVFQQYNLFPHFTALQNVVEPMIRVLRCSRDEAEAKAVALLSEVGLQAHLKHLPIQLSGGQQQRVAIARSVALQPKVILFDEVTSALDPELVGEVLRVMRDLADHGDMAMLLVTHEMNFAADIANRVLMFDGGRIVEQGPPSQVLHAPTHSRTQQFLRAILER